MCPEFDVFSEHCFPTLSYGEACTSLGEPYIGNCQYDGAGASLSVLYGNLKARTTAVSANLLTFDQTQVWTRTFPLHQTHARTLRGVASPGIAAIYRVFVSV